jgi:hypothetical protein
MLKILTSAVVLSGLAIAGAQAKGLEFDKIDTDKNGFVSMKELLVVLPTVTDAQFQLADVSNDGQLSEIEFDNATTPKG